MVTVVGFAASLREMKENKSVLWKQNFEQHQNSESDEQLSLFNQ